MAAQKGQLLSISIEMYGKITNFNFINHIYYPVEIYHSYLEYIVTYQLKKIRLLGATIIILC